MAGELVARLLRSKSEFSEEEIATMSEADGWRWVYSYRPKNEVKEQVCFTGFRPPERKQLSLVAEEAGLQVVTSITKSLNYLCVGDSPGTQELQQAAEHNVMVLKERQFYALLETWYCPAAHNRHTWRLRLKYANRHLLHRL